MNMSNTLLDNWFKREHYNQGKYNLLKVRHTELRLHLIQPNLI